MKRLLLVSLSPAAQLQLPASLVGGLVAFQMLLAVLLGIGLSIRPTALAAHPPNAAAQQPSQLANLGSIVRLRAAAGPCAPLQPGGPGGPLDHGHQLWAMRWPLPAPLATWSVALLYGLCGLRALITPWLACRFRC